MFNVLLRQIPVRWRIIGGFMLLLAVAGSVSPLILLNYNALIARMEQFTSVDAKIERLLLLASRQVKTSQLNLNRYMQDYVPSPYEALDDADQALKNLKEAQALSTNPNQREVIALLIRSLEEYKQQIGDLQKARAAGDNAGAQRLGSRLQKLSNDISTRLELTVDASVKSVSAVNQEVFHQARQSIRNSILLMASGFLFAILLSALVVYSITRPLADLRAGTEAFQKGDLLTTIPEIGSDEFTDFARLFNRLGQQLHGLITALEQRVEERTTALSRKTSQLQAASYVARQAAEIKDPAALLNDAVRLISDQFGFYHAGLFLLDENGQYAVLQAASSEGGQRMLARGHRLRVGEQGIVGYVAAQKRPRIALDTGADAVYFDNPDLPATRSEAALPLIVRERVIGVLDIQSEKPQAFTQDDIEIFQTLADQLALAIDNARLFGEMQTAVQQLEQAAARNVREVWSRFGRFGEIAFRYTPFGIQSLQKEAPLSSTAAQLKIPIALRGQKIGEIIVHRKDKSLEWSEREKAMIEEIATQTALALENARLLEEAQRRAALEHALGEISNRIQQTLDMEVILRMAAQETQRALRLPEVTVQLNPLLADITRETPL